jgi:hypothetical protein
MGCTRMGASMDMQLKIVCIEIDAYLKMKYDMDAQEWVHT